jgi:hypothetical protein
MQKPKAYSSSREDIRSQEERELLKRDAEDQKMAEDTRAAKERGKRIAKSTIPRKAEATLADMLFPIDEEEGVEVPMSRHSSPLSNVSSERSAINVVLDHSPTCDTASTDPPTSKIALTTSVEEDHRFEDSISARDDANIAFAPIEMDYHLDPCGDEYVIGPQSRPDRSGENDKRSDSNRASGDRPVA